MILRLIHNRVKTDLNFPVDIIKDCCSTALTIITTFFFWSILIEKYGIFGLTKGEIFLFLFYQTFTYFFVRYFFKMFKNMVRDLISGEIISKMVYPRNIYIYYFFRDFEIPYHYAMEMVSYLSLSILFGVDINKYFLFGILLSALAVFSLVSFFYFFHSISLLYHLMFGMEEVKSFVKFGGKYPTFIYKGALHFLLNVFIPSFSYGSLSVYFYKFKTIGIFIYSIPVSITFLSLGEVIRRIAWRRFEGYGI